MGSPNVSGAAGKVRDDGSASAGAAPSNGGTTAGGAPASAGSPAGGGGSAGALSAGSGGSAAALGEGGAAGAGEAAGAGGQSLPGCRQLECLAGAEWVYWPDREWQRSTANPASTELLEADYQPKMASPWDVQISSDGQQILLTARAGGNAVQGLRDAQRTDRAWFDLMLAIGGRFVVQVGAPNFQAEYTAYGSGVPIVSSTRGALTLKQP